MVPVRCHDGVLMFNITEQDHDDVVALYINGDICLGPYAVEQARNHGKVDGYILRHVFKLMAEMDLNPKWAEYAEYPTLFTITEYNNWVKLPNGKPIC
jgi:hypothetical protein